MSISRAELKHKKEQKYGTKNCEGNETLIRLVNQERRHMQRILATSRLQWYAGHVIQSV
jgi:hypothetical protein